MQSQLAPLKVQIELVGRSAVAALVLRVATGLVMRPSHRARPVDRHVERIGPAVVELGHGLEREVLRLLCRGVMVLEVVSVRVFW